MRLNINDGVQVDLNKYAAKFFEKYGTDVTFRDFRQNVSVGHLMDSLNGGSLRDADIDLTRATEIFKKAILPNPRTRIFFATQLMRQKLNQGVNGYAFSESKEHLDFKLTGETMELGFPDNVYADSDSIETLKPQSNFSVSGDFGNNSIYVTHVEGYGDSTVEILVPLAQVSEEIPKEAILAPYDYRNGSPVKLRDQHITPLVLKTIAHLPPKPKQDAVKYECSLEMHNGDYVGIIDLKSKGLFIPFDGAANTFQFLTMNYGLRRYSTETFSHDINGFYVQPLDLGRKLKLTLVDDKDDFKEKIIRTTAYNADFEPVPIEIKIIS